MELIFRYEKITLVRWECCKCSKVTISSPYSLTSGRFINKRSIYLLNMLSTRSYLFQNTFIFCKNTIFHKTSPNNIFFVKVEKNPYASLNPPKSWGMRVNLLSPVVGHIFSENFIEIPQVVQKI